MSGRIATRPLDPAHERAFIGDSRAVVGFSLPAEPWTVKAVVCVGDIADLTQLADAFEVALRGADLLVEVAPALVEALADQAIRAGLQLWKPPAEAIRPEWAGLLDALAGGASIAQAARGCHMSPRSAYRRLEDARRALGASTTTAAVTRWATGDRDREPHESARVHGPGAAAS